MKRRWKRFVSALLACLMLAALAPAASAQEDTKEAQEMPLLTGMFVATELTTQGDPWTQEDWNTAVAQLKDVGMDKLVLQYAVQYYSETSKVYYYTPTFDDPGENLNNRQQAIEYALNACRDNGVQLWLGLHLAEDLWFSAMDAGFRDVGEDGRSAFLTFSADYSAQVFDDLWSQYGEEYGDVIGGWYLPYEFNNTVGEAARTRLVEDFYAPLTAHIKAVTPQKQILISPLVYPPMLTQPTQEMLDTWEMLCYDVWANSQVDIIAPQDGCGWESSMKENLPPFYEAMAQARSDAQTVRDRKGYGRAIAWNNPEVYSMTGSNTMTMRRFTDNMKAVDAYVDEHVSFSLHSLVWLDSAEKGGTNVTNRAFYEAYAYLAENGALYELDAALPAVQGLVAEVRDTYDAVLTWERVDDSALEMPVAGYQVRRVDEGADESQAILLSDVPQPAQGSVTMVDAQLEPGHTYRYSVYAYDGTGNLSGEAATVQVTIADDTLALRTVSQKGVADAVTLSAYSVEGAEARISGDVAALNGGGTVRFAPAEGASEAKYVLHIDNAGDAPLGMVYLLVQYSPAEGQFFPQKIEVLADGQLVNTMYPQSEYASSMVGTVYLPVSLNGASAGETLELVITQNQPYLALEGLKAYTRDANTAVPDGYTEPENVVQGQPVAITGYAAGQSFDANAHFMGADRLTLDYEEGLVTSEANLYKGSYASDLLTRGTVDLPYVGWQEDGGACRISGKAADADRSVWLRTINLGGESFDLSVELPAPQAVSAISTEWLSDRDSAVYLPLYIEYYGMTQSGVEQLIGTASRPMQAQINFDEPPAQDNCHRTETFRYKVADESGTVYTRIIARVYPQYPANSHFMRAFAVYDTNS